MLFHVMYYISYFLRGHFNLVNVPLHQYLNTNINTKSVSFVAKLSQGRLKGTDYNNNKNIIIDYAKAFMIGFLQKKLSSLNFFFL